MSLAERFDGEIINGDAIQLYNGLSIATNKLPIKARRSIPHHLLGCLGLKEKPWEVSTFRRNAINVIEDIQSRGKLPILVGGTHYYTQALLFKNGLVEVDGSRAGSTEDQAPILHASTQAMLEELRKVDPVMAARWHPSDRRKIRRSLEIYLTTGQKASDIYEQERRRLTNRGPDNIDPKDNVDDENQNLENGMKSSLLFDSLIFWIHSDLDVLEQRLEKRLSTMLTDGLVSEVEDMHATLQKMQSEGHVVDQSYGIWAAIGYKEFGPYLSALKAADVSREDLEKLKEKGIEQVRFNNRRYARSQARWIRFKLLRALTDAQLDKTLYLLDGTDPSKRSHDVDNIAFEITKAFLNGQPQPSPKSISEAAERMLVACKGRVMKARYCDVCHKTLMSELEWDLHLKGKKHLNALKPKIDWSTLYPRKESNISTPKYT